MGADDDPVGEYVEFVRFEGGRGSRARDIHLVRLLNALSTQPGKQIRPKTAAEKGEDYRRVSGINKIWLRT